MKKFFCMLLLCSMLLSLWGCGADKPRASAPAASQPSLPGGTTAPEVPTEEEWAQLRAYCEIVDSLYYYGSHIHGYSGQAAVKYCYQQLQAMSHLDKWIASEHLTPMHDLSPLGDLAYCVRLPRKPIVDGFVTVEDVLLTETIWYIDALENKSIVRDREYQYNTAGELQSDFDSFPNGDLFWDDAFSLDVYYEYPLKTGTPEHTYDVQGCITQSRYLHHDGTVNCILQYTYNTDGTLATESYRDRNGNEYYITYTYADGLLIKKEGVPYAINQRTANVEYTYNEAGQLTKEYHDRSNPKEIFWRDLLIEYSYDRDGTLQSASGAGLAFQRNSTDTYLMGYGSARYFTYSYDDTGRLSQVTYQEMGSYDENGNYTSGKSDIIYYIDYAYGDFYIPPSIPME